MRLAAIHSFFRYVALHAPENSAVAQRVLAMQSKRYVRRPISFLTPVEIDALLAAPDLKTWSGRRDRTVLLLAVQTGLRAAELTGLRCENIVLGTGAHVQCLGKGRKTRCTPLRERYHRGAAQLATKNVRVNPPIRSLQPRRVTLWVMTASEYLLNKHLAVARRHCPSLIKKRITPHSLEAFACNEPASSRR